MTTEVASPPAEPTTPAEAQVRLSQAKQDPAWTKALLEGGPKQLTEFHKLHEMIGSPVDADKAMAGEFMGVNSAEHIQAMGVAAHLRESGLDDAVIKQALTGSPVTRAEYDAVAKWKAAKMVDHEFTKALMAGDGEPKRLWRAANIVLTNGFKSE